MDGKHETVKKFRSRFPLGLILPKDIRDYLEEHGYMDCRYKDDQVINALNNVFKRMERSRAREIGDAFMSVGGLMDNHRIEDLFNTTVTGRISWPERWMK